MRPEKYRSASEGVKTVSSATNIDGDGALVAPETNVIPFPGIRKERLKARLRVYADHVVVDRAIVDQVENLDEVKRQLDEVYAERLKVEGRSTFFGDPMRTPPVFDKRSASSREITVFTSVNPLSKRIELRGNELDTTSNANFWRGSAERVRVSGVKQLAELIKQFNPRQALSTGTLLVRLPDKVRVTTKEHLRNGVARPDVIARSKEYIEYRPEQPGFVLLDADAKGMPDTVAARIEQRGGFYRTLCSILPVLANVARVERRSTSSGLSRTDTNEPLPGKQNLHVYIEAKDASDAERFLRVLHGRCWLAGYGWGMLDEAGKFLERSPIDRVVGSPERLVFEGAPILKGPLRQEGRDPVAIEGSVLDTVTACPDLTDDELEQVNRFKAAERRRLKPEATKVRNAYVKREAKKIVARNPEITMRAARRAIRLQAVDSILLPHIKLQFDDKNFAGCTVADVLEDPQRFERATLADPVAGIGYGRCKAMVLLHWDDGTPWINSYAHHGRKYQLKYDAVTVRKAIDQVDKEKLVNAFVGLAAVAELSKREAGDLCDLVAERSGINRSTIATKLKVARDSRLKPAEPTYPAKRYAAPDMPRAELRRIATEFFFDEVCMPEDRSDGLGRVPYQTIGYDNYFPHDAWMVIAELGLGKTRIVIEVSSVWKRQVDVGPIIYAVPTLDLADEIAKQYVQRGLDARVFRGRGALDPEHFDPAKADDDQIQMCLNPDAVELALKAHADIYATCCKSKGEKCRFSDQCGYLRQMPEKGDQPDVWVIAADMLFHAQPALGDASCLIIDESFWEKGLRGIGDDRWSIEIDDLIAPVPAVHDFYDDATMRISDRNLLAQALLRQQGVGGVERSRFADFSEQECHEIIRREWDYLRELGRPLHPGMSASEIKKLKNNDTLEAIGLTRRVIKIWQEVQNMIRHPEIAVSGSLIIKQKKKARHVAWRGVADFTDQFIVPTLMLDATPPGLSIIHVYNARAKIVADLSVAMPSSVHTKQFLGSPSSSSKLKGSKKHRDSVLCSILQQWLELCRPETLITCQKDFEEWLQEQKLPDNIHTLHFNNLAGIDKYKGVRLHFTIGRTAPGRLAPESVAAAITGKQPKMVDDPNDFWYPLIKRGIRLTDGSGILVMGEQHPDPLVEAVRWQQTEAQLVQANGRSRGINRDDKTPLTRVFLFDTCLPETVDEVLQWEKPSLLIKTAVEGFMLTSPADLVKVRPDLWPNTRTADRTIEAGVPVLPGFVQVNYKLAGSKRKSRIGWFDLGIVPDPIAWLRERLGSPVRQG